MKLLTNESEKMFPNSCGDYSNKVYYFQFPHFRRGYSTNMWEPLEKNKNYLWCEKINNPTKRLSSFTSEFKSDLFEPL